MLQDEGDLKGECKCHGNIGLVQLALANLGHALKSFLEELERACELKDTFLQANAQGHVGIVKLSMRRYDEAIACFEQQLAFLSHTGSERESAMSQMEAKAHSHLASCYEFLRDFEEASKCHLRCLQLANLAGAHFDAERAYRHLGKSMRELGRFQEASVSDIVVQPVTVDDVSSFPGLFRTMAVFNGAGIGYRKASLS